MSSGAQPAVAIVAALPRELAPLSRNLQATTVLRAEGILLQVARPAGRRVLLVTAGMGSPRAALAVAAALGHGPVSSLLSVGLAGACDPALAVANLVEATLVIDSHTGERFTPSTQLGLGTPGVLVSISHIAGPAEKQRLHDSYTAAAVDMEAATVARLARAHDLPFAALKAISDEYPVDLTHLAPFSSTRGHFRTGSFAFHTALRPHRWRGTMALGRHSSLALRALAEALSQALREPQA